MELLDAGVGEAWLAAGPGNSGAASAVSAALLRSAMQPSATSNRQWMTRVMADRNVMFNGCLAADG
jgi:hypothetical protein